MLRSFLFGTLIHGASLGRSGVDLYIIHLLFHRSAFSCSFTGAAVSGGQG
jgi:hypothetical protein